MPITKYFVWKRLRVKKTDKLIEFEETAWHNTSNLNRKLVEKHIVRIIRKRGPVWFEFGAAISISIWRDRIDYFSCIRVRGGGNIDSTNQCYALVICNDFIGLRVHECVSMCMWAFQFDQCSMLVVLIANDSVSIYEFNLIPSRINVSFEHTYPPQKLEKLNATNELRAIVRSLWYPEHMRPFPFADFHLAKN